MKKYELSKLLDEKVAFERAFDERLENLRRELDDVAPDNLKWANQVLTTIMERGVCKIEWDCLDGNWVDTGQLRSNLPKLQRVWSQVIDVKYQDCQTHILITFMPA